MSSVWVLVMNMRGFLTVIAMLGLLGPGSSSVYAFRACSTDAVDIYSATTRYVVGEITFDSATGQASGTETTYNYADPDFEGFHECHVTYELSGIIEPGSGTFVLDARRTNYSSACPAGLIDARYPGQQLYVFQMTFEMDGTSKVHIADNGEFFADGDWDAGRTFYRTGEKCTSSKS